MKRLIVLLGLLFATAAMAADNPIACSGASCGITVNTRDGSSVSSDVGKFTTAIPFTLKGPQGSSVTQFYGNQVHPVTGEETGVINAPVNRSFTVNINGNSSTNDAFYVVTDPSAGGTADTSVFKVQNNGTTVVGQSPGTDLTTLSITGKTSTIGLVNYDGEAFNVAANANITQATLGGVAAFKGRFAFQTASGPFTLHGYSAGSGGDVVYLINRSGQTMTLAHESGTEGSASSRFLTRTAGNISVPNNAGVIVMHTQNSAGALRWFVMSP